MLGLFLQLLAMVVVLAGGLVAITIWAHRD
jgi:hypothetical protein